MRFAERLQSVLGKKPTQRGNGHAATVAASTFFSASFVTVNAMGIGGIVDWAGRHAQGRHGHHDPGDPRPPAAGIQQAKDHALRLAWHSVRSAAVVRLESPLVRGLALGPRLLPARSEEEGPSGPSSTARLLAASRPGRCTSPMGTPAWLARNGAAKPRTTSISLCLK